MLNVVLFALVLGMTLVIVNLVASMVTMHLFMREKTLKKYAKMYYNVVKDTMEEVFHEEDESN